MAGFDPWQALQAASAFLFIACLVPQAMRTLRRRRAEDVSVGFLVLVLFGSLASFVYFIHRREWFFVASFACNLVVWGGVLYYRLHPALPQAAKANL